MTILTWRNPSQILRTFLPGQTADIGGEIFRVDDWPGARPLVVDVPSVRRRLIREIAPFEVHGRDSGLASDLRRGQSLEVVEIDLDSGVTVERYPRVWLCPVCKRIGKTRDQACRCGARTWRQMHFLGVHSCGHVVEPWIRRCSAHDDVQVVSPRSARAQDIVFRCPVCHVEISKGLGFVRCTACGEGFMSWNVHKARPVFAPREMVMINPPRPEALAALRAAGGERKALEWVLDGMRAEGPEQLVGPPHRPEFVETLVASGFDRATAENLADQAEQAGALGSADDGLSTDLDESVLEQAADEAFDVALAMSASRLQVSGLRSAPVGPVLHRLYAVKYPEAMQRAGISGIDLVDRFPVMSIVYGYTRGSGDPVESTLRPFRGRRTAYRSYGQFAETEALFVRLEPQRVARWLGNRGHELKLGESPTERAARVAVLRHAPVPAPGAAAPSPGKDLITLLHSYSHRFIRQTSVLAGIDRDALAEYLVPAHLGFFMFAASRGNFVLGGLQAVVEQELHTLLDSFVDAEHRCPLDPGCVHGGGACAACLHLGEPSCRRFNTDLDRRALFDSLGYLRLEPGVEDESLT